MLRQVVPVAIAIALSGCISDQGLTGSIVTYEDIQDSETDTANGPWTITAELTIPAGTKHLRGEWERDDYSGSWHIWLEGPDGERIYGPCGESPCGPSVSTTGQSSLYPSDDRTPGRWTMHAEGEGVGQVEVHLFATIPAE